MPGAPTAALLGGALLLAGLGFASPSLIVPGIGLLALATLSFAWVSLAVRGLRVERGAGPSRLVEGELYPVRIAARGGLAPPPGGRLHDPLLAEPVELGPRWDGLHTAAVAVEGRGLRRLGAPRVEVSDPLGLWTRTVAGQDARELLVLPRIEPVVVDEERGGGAGAGAGLELGPGRRGQASRAIELEVDGLRAYREGTPASRIHWPAVARSGELIERRLVAGSEAAPLVVLDAGAPAGEAELDAAVRAAASLACHLALAGGCAVLLPGERRPTELDPELAAWPALHARLALVEPAGGPAPAGRLARAGALLWVTATERPRLPAALASPGGRRYLVAPAGHMGGRRAFTVAGCEGVLVAGAARRRRHPVRRPAARRAA